jgi:hypothetical protein
MFLDAFGIAATQDTEQLIIGDEEEARERIPLGVQVIVQRFLALFKTS